MNYGGKDGKEVICYYVQKTDVHKRGLLQCKLETYNRDVYHSVTKDEKQVYVKLVNAEDFEKRTRVQLDNLMVKPTAELVRLTGAKNLVHTVNVNTREAELVSPTRQKVKVKTKGKEPFVELKLPANSVTVLILKRA